MSTMTKKHVIYGALWLLTALLAFAWMQGWTAGPEGVILAATPMTAGQFGDLPALATANLVDTVLNTGTKSGYNFVATPTVAPTTPVQYYATAVPVTTSGVGATGTRRFGISEDGVLHGDSGGALAVYADEAAVQAASAIGQ